VDPEELRREVLSRAGTDPHAVGDVPQPTARPLCPHCRAGLDATAAHRPLTVTNIVGDDPVTVTVVYCRACGTALGIKP